MQANIPSKEPLCVKFDVNTCRHCGEMAWIEENLHTFGNSNITTLVSPRFLATTKAFVACTGNVSLSGVVLLPQTIQVVSVPLGLVSM